MRNQIKIVDWCGNILYQGPYNSKLVDKVLDLNRCTCKEGCHKCDDSGYSGDFEVYWLDENDSRNVYEFINY